MVATLPQPLFLLSSMVSRTPPLEVTKLPRYLAAPASFMSVLWIFSFGQGMVFCASYLVELPHFWFWPVLTVVLGLRNLSLSLI